MGADRALFVHADVGDERSIEDLERRAERVFERVDIIVNNAAVEPVGAVTDARIEAWDLSYRVNLRGPVLQARAIRMVESTDGPDSSRRAPGGA